VLLMLALRLDWATGTGYASTAQLCADTGASEITVRRALAWARKAGLLNRTRRGHRLGNGRAVASEWALALPSQPVTKKGLSQDSQPVTKAGLRNLNRSVEASQPVSPAPPSRPSTSRPPYQGSALAEPSPDKGAHSRRATPDGAARPRAEEQENPAEPEPVQAETEDQERQRQEGDVVRIEDAIAQARAAVNAAKGPPISNGYERGRPATDPVRMAEAIAELAEFRMRKDDPFTPQGRLSA
jgi:hypothetical protein